LSVHLECFYPLAPIEINKESETDLPNHGPDGARHFNPIISGRRESAGFGVENITKENIDIIDGKEVIGIRETTSMKAKHWFLTIQLLRSEWCWNS